MKKFDNFVANLEVLQKAKDQDLDNEFVLSGIADKFALQFELSWKLLKELLLYEGDIVSASGSPRDVLKGSYRAFDFIEEDAWLSMLQDRNALFHSYDVDALMAIIDRIISGYIPAFQSLRESLESKYGTDLKLIA